MSGSGSHTPPISMLSMQARGGEVVLIVHCASVLSISITNARARTHTTTHAHTHMHAHTEAKAKAGPQYRKGTESGQTDDDDILDIIEIPSGGGGGAHGSSGGGGSGSKRGAFGGGGGWQGFLAPDHRQASGVVCACVCVCVCVCACACVRAYVHTCIRVCELCITQFSRHHRCSIRGRGCTWPSKP